MSVTLLTAPPALSFSADLISAKFACTDYLQQVGVKSVNKLSISLTIADGTPVEIKYGNTTVAMTAKLVPDDSGTQFLAYGGPLSPSAQIFAVYFRQNYQLSRDFDISYAGDDLYFDAKTKSLGFDFKSPGAGSNTVAGLPAIKQPNYTVLFKLFLENEANTAFDLIYTTNLQLLPNTDGQAEAMIGDKIHTVITKAIRASLPEQPNATVIQCKNSCRRYYFEFAESYGEPITVKKLNTSGIFTALHGGLSSIAQSKANVFDRLQPNTPDNDRFLTQFSTLQTRTNQLQYLYFYNTRTTATVSLVAVFTFTDDTTHTISVDDIAILENRKYAFNTSFDQIYSDPVDGKVVAYYTVSLMVGPNRVTEEKRYSIDYTNRSFLRYFLNWSSFGGLDSRYFYGKGESEFELTNNTADRIRQVGEPLQYGQSLVFDSQLKRQFSIATGFKTKEEILLNADFFLSNLKYRVTNGVFMPIIVSPGKIKEVTDGNNLLAQSFEYQYLITDHAYTEGDAEDVGVTISGFYNNQYPSNLPFSGGSDLGVWRDVSGKSAYLVETINLQYKTDALGINGKATTFINAQFTLSGIVATSLLIGQLPAGSRPSAQIIKYFIVNNIELFLIVNAFGEINIVSKDGLSLPVGISNETTYLINLNFKPVTA